VACREVKDNRDLTRIVRLPDGKVSIDPRGRLAGRGAYICSNPDCWQACLNSNRLDYVLKTNIAPDERERLLAEGQSLIGGG
jgi:predicted RNA-binding protein YlxR (DUF448 family)